MNNTIFKEMDMTSDSPSVLNILNNNLPIPETNNDVTNLLFGGNCDTVLADMSSATSLSEPNITNIPQQPIIKTVSFANQQSPQSQSQAQSQAQRQPQRQPQSQPQSQPQRQPQSQQNQQVLKPALKQPVSKLDLINVQKQIEIEKTNCDNTVNNEVNEVNNNEAINNEVNNEVVPDLLNTNTIPSHLLQIGKYKAPKQTLLLFVVLLIIGGGLFYFTREKKNNLKTDKNKEKKDKDDKDNN